MVLKSFFSIKFKSKKFTLKNISEKDIKQNYISSLNKSLYLGSSKNKHTLSSQKKYLNLIKKKKNNLILGLYQNNILVGTAGLQFYKSFKTKNLNLKNAASFGLLIFYNHRGNRYGELLITSVTFILKNFFLSRKIFAAISPYNHQSIKIFENSGFKKIEEKNINSFIYLFMSKKN